MTIEALTGSRPWLTAGWTMLHFLWVGAALGLIAAGGRRALRRAAPEARYGFALACLIVMALAPAGIALLRPAASDRRAVPVIPRSEHSIAWPPPTADTPALDIRVMPAEPGTATGSPTRDRPRRGSPWAHTLEAVAAGLPWLWIVGAPATFSLLATGLVGAERLRRRSQPLADGELAGLARRLAAALGIARPVALCACDRIVAPILLGIVRPMILLPSAALAGWSPEQLEMALLHELAHVRRLDNFVNLAQRVIESLLFFHPAVWWVSGWVRLEREHCCDRLVVSRTGRARPYAEMLAGLALRGCRPGPAAVAMAESPVVARIRRILNMEDHLMPLSRPVVALGAALLVAPAVLIASQAGAPGRGREEPRKSDPQPDRARVEGFLRRTRHGADMFLDVQSRAYTLSQVAGVQARAGDREAARLTFRQAELLAETVSFEDAYYAPHILLWVAQAEQRHGFRDEAIAAAQKLTRLAEAPARRESQKTDLYANLIELQRKLGDRDGVQETLRAGRRFLENSKEPGFRAFAPQFLVRDRAASGDLAGALRMVHDPDLFRGRTAEEAANLRHGALINVVAAIGPDNREGAGPVLEEALRAVADNKDALPWRRVTINNQDLQWIASAQTKLGRFDEAVKSARMMDAENAPGHLAKAREAELLDEQRSRKAATLAAIVLEQAKAGDRAGARRAVEEAARIAGAIRTETYQYMPVSQTLAALVKLGDTAAALRLADTLSPDSRIGLYQEIAAARRDAGDAAGARETLQAALELARKRLDGAKVGMLDADSSEGKQVNRRLEVVGRLQAKLGDRKQALETIRRINDGGRQLEALKGMAADLAADGDLDGALEAIDQMNSPKSAAEALEQVASVLSHRETAPPARR